MPNKYKAKYIHIFYGHDLKFSRPLIEAFNDPDSGIRQEEHLFVIMYSHLYAEMKHHNNVILDDSRSNLLLKYGKQCKWLIAYGLPSSIQVFLTPRNIRKKTIYRYGGGSCTTHLVYNKGKILQNIKTFSKRLLFNISMKSFAAIGVAGSVDIIDLSKVIKNGRYIYLNYAYGRYGLGKKAVLEEIGEQNLEDKCKKKINILLGHRGTPENNHIEILKRLERFDKRELCIYIPLSYGKPEYINCIREYINKKNYGNVVVINEFLDYKEYASLLQTMDIGIFDGYTSYALGNIRILLFFRKTVYLRDSGVLAEAFKYEGVPYKSIEQIESMTFEEFIEPVKYIENGARLLSQDVDGSKRNWDHFFDVFN